MTDDTAPRPAIGHMPFPGHRNMAEVMEDQKAAFRALGKKAAR